MRAVGRALNRIRITKTLGVSDVILRVADHVGQDHVGAYARSLAFNVFFALFPLLAFLVSMFVLILGPEDLGSLINSIQTSTAIPVETRDFIIPELSKLQSAASSQGLFTGAAVASLFITLWAVSGAFRSVMEAMNTMYGLNESRSIFRRYWMSILLSVIAAILLVSALVIVVTGHDLVARGAQGIGLGAFFDRMWAPLLGGFVLFAVLLAFALVYHWGPSTTRPFRLVTLGSAVAFVLWLAYSYLFSLYVRNIGAYNRTFGALAGIAIVMLYVNYSAFIMLIGAEINRVVEESGGRARTSLRAWVRERTRRRTPRRGGDSAVPRQR